MRSTSGKILASLPLVGAGNSDPDGQILRYFRRERQHILKAQIDWKLRGNGAPDSIRTCDLHLWMASLNPAELRVRSAYVVLTRIS